MKRLWSMLVLLCLVAGPAQARHRHNRHWHRRHHRVPHGLIYVPRKPGIDRGWSVAVGRRIRGLNPTHGAFVAIDADTGRILAMTQYNRSKKSRFRPAFSARYPTASVFKIVSSAALLSTKKVFPWTKVCYHGGELGIGWGNLRPSRRDNKCRSLYMAFAHSTNAVLARLSARYLTGRLLYKMAKAFGFNRRWRLPGLHTSRVSMPRGRLVRARMASGFTHAHMSPIHAAVLAAVVVNGGRLVFPHWGRKVIKNSGISCKNRKHKNKYRVISTKVARSLQKMMLETTARGTAAKYLSWARQKGLDIGCKTGTLTGSGLKNSWMVCFVRNSDTKIAFAVLSANRGYYRKSGFIAVSVVRYLVKKRMALVQKKRLSR